MIRYRIKFNNTEILIYEIRRKNVFISVLAENNINYELIEESYEN